MSTWSKIKKIANPQNAIAIAAAPFTAGTSLALLNDGNKSLIKGAMDEITGASSAKKANDANIAMQEKINAENKALQQETNATSIELANTAHQREIEDLKKAGLNPILSAGGSGAVTPSLGTAQMQATQVQNEMPGGYMAQAGAAANIIGMLSQAKASSAAANLSQQQALNTATDTKYMPAMKKAEIAAQYANAGNAKAQADYTNVMKDVDYELKKAQKESQEWENEINKDLGTSKNDNGIYRSFKNAARSLFDLKYNPLK